MNMDTRTSNPDHHNQSSRLGNLWHQLIGHKSHFKSLDRKLAATPFAASLLSPQDTEQCKAYQTKLQRIIDISVSDVTRMKKNRLVATLQISLRANNPRRNVDIFVPNDSPQVHEKVRSVEEVHQLWKLLMFCVHPDREDEDTSRMHCNQECKFCAELLAFLSNHWANEPLVGVSSLRGNTFLRKTVFANFLVHLVAFATRQISNNLSEAGTQDFHLLPLQASAAGQSRDESICAAHLDVISVLFDFLDGDEIFGDRNC